MTALRLDLTLPAAGGHMYVTEVAFFFLRDTPPHWLPVPSWVRCLTALGLPAPTARTALHRMTRGEFLQRTVHEGQPGYAMSPEWLSWMDRATAPTPPEDAYDWLVVTFSVPESERATRHRLRALLTRHGFGCLSSGVWLGSAASAPSVQQVLQDVGLDGYVVMFAATHLGDSEAVAAKVWDVAGLRVEYDQLRVAAERLLDEPFPRPVDAFVQLVGIANRRRLLEERHPRFPAGALPAGWPALEAETLVAEAVLRRLPLARDYVFGAHLS